VLAKPSSGILPEKLAFGDNTIVLLQLDLSRWRKINNSVRSCTNSMLTSASIRVYRSNANGQLALPMTGTCRMKIYKIEKTFIWIYAPNRYLFKDPGEGPHRIKPYGG
jgi:hypothetical protein